PLFYFFIYFSFQPKWSVSLKPIQLSAKLRSKRCACSSVHDSECFYFCHLDIIWVNTPSKTTLYGLGGAKARQPRSAGRCTCANLDDLICTRFCYRRKNIQVLCAVNTSRFFSRALNDLFELSCFFSIANNGNGIILSQSAMFSSYIIY
uniref:Endothelin-like toxin domain-containing protein n=1 Tax=Hippocampus comes TaxID=109280 RepID=A0A3Q2XX96_HIPCM